MNITDFLVRFECSYHKLVVFDIKLPEGVQTFFLLMVANVSEENKCLEHATWNFMTYKNMKDCLCKIFRNFAACMWGSNAPAIKSESVFIRDHENPLQVKGCPGHKTFLRTTSYFCLFKMHNNPIGRDRKVLKYFKCNSRKQLARYCNYWPPREVQNKNIHITLLSAEIPILVKEALGMGVLDSILYQICYKYTVAKCFFACIDRIW